MNCLSLKSILIPSSIQTIGEYAFGYPNEEITDFTIYCILGSAGEEYAKDNSCDYQLIEE